MSRLSQYDLFGLSKNCKFVYAKKKSARRYPERTAALIMASAISYIDPSKAEDREKEASINRVIRSDFVYWIGITQAIIILIIIGGTSLHSCQNYSAKELSEKHIANIKAEIKEMALKHLNSESAISALSYYTKDPTIISNGILYSSFESFAEEIKEFYGSLSKINLAAYDEMDINVITHDVALFTAKFRWSSTDTDGMTIDLQGVYSALYVRQDGRWKMSWRHESYLPMKK